jgi:hypothetical protein
MTTQVVELIGCVVGFALIFGLVAVLQTRKRDRQRSERETLAAQRGWTYSGKDGATIWRLSGKRHGVAWTVDCQCPLQSYDTGHPDRTRFTTTVPETGGVLVSHKIFGSNIASLVEGAVELMIGSAGFRLLQSGNMLPQSGPFGEHFEVREAQPGTAERVLGESVRRALLDQRERMPRTPPTLVLDQGQLVVLIGWYRLEVDDVEAFVTTGLSILDALARKL